MKEDILTVGEYLNHSCASSFKLWKNNFIITSMLNLKNFKENEKLEVVFFSGNCPIPLKAWDKLSKLFRKCMWLP